MVAFATAGLIIYVRNEWKMLRIYLFKKPEAMLEQGRPGRVADHLDFDRWETAYRATLERARSDFARDGGPAAAAALGVLEAARDDVAPLVREVAARSMTRGALQSVLIRLDGVTVYALATPGRYEDRRTLRRDESLAEGWPAHAAAIRRAAAGLPLIGLLYFLGTDAHDGTLLVAYEGDENRFFPAELDAPPSSPAPARPGPNWTYEFALA